MKHWNKITTAIALTSCMVFPAFASELKVFNWAEYMGEDTLANFTKETGIEVVYDTYDSLESMETKILTGGAGYDVVFAAGPVVERFVGAKLLQKLDQESLTNKGNLDASLMKVLAGHDPDNAHAIPYMWGTVGIAYNKALIEKRMKDAPLNSLDIIFKPEISAKFADCGIAILDSPGEVLNVALNYLGLDPTSSKKGDIKKAQELVTSIRPNIRYFNSVKPIDDLATGEICMALMYSGDAGIAADAASNGGKGIEISYSIPKEGTMMWFDSMVIPTDAVNTKEAHQFIDYMMRPKVIAEISNGIFYANANTASLEFVDKDITSDPNIFPPEDVRAKLFPDVALAKKSTRLRTRAWTKVKTGR
ncbi:spermidine/putrescine ABC transporter substrate-binding protein PotF [Cocleimonas flava]|uniref:Putrescine-binding periplasmic protein n=1 Tax=Cocleimonas flava TaxID=634765 RepID=A0A4R1EV95_9GAMM|nr:MULTISPECIES: polyamine ABC transporter substrate-binding protein [Cocleimonas]MEB8432648.1 polyamine ABC transporter substrate-binding protein [Cocleimonas sp. KMM 6892]MEC4715507.1 polyamine ABC transporter substrate-binding protein [Cocleimonas sp. KMM 6895]MEC4744875.1 polyamine ABC transporter substrate-binding protein [Cocleimonas sp. KMM 6896]TCJ83058.1 putrescine transport system substrate-binding protein [Cocleimonas flava]